jgi:hypothetical protein
MISGKTLRLEGESNEGTIIISFYLNDDNVGEGVILATGSSSLSMSNLKIIQSNGNGINRDLICFNPQESTASFDMENCIILQQDVSFIYFFVFFYLYLFM